MTEYSVVPRPRGLQAKTLTLIEAAYTALATVHPMTLRQCFYQLVVCQAITNNKAAYRTLGRALVEARKQGLIPWEWIEDRTRKPRCVPMWDDPQDFVESVVPQYRRNPWPSYSQYVHVWLEKDALSGIFENVLAPYGVALNVGRGFDGWASIYGTAIQCQKIHKPVRLLYFGDFDPSGENMGASLRKRLDFFRKDGQLDVDIEIERIAILREDIERYDLPPDFAKQTDSRTRNFVERFGEETVELDALPTEVLRERLLESVERNLDLDQLARTRKLDEREMKALKRSFSRRRS